jgi:glycosyltransferase involved in cell wall biosynthesis
VPDSRPRISIVTPNRNHGRYLRQCIDSVLSQGHADVEHRVFDAGSQDESLEVLRSRGDAVSWVSGPDAGQAAAINEGFRKATGDVVAWLNSDDYYLPGAFDAALDALARDPGAAAVHGNAWMVDEAGRRTGRYPTFAVRRRDLAPKCYVCQPTVFLRRSVLDEVGLLNEDLELCFDYEWWLRILRDHRMAFCERPLAATRQHARTKTRARRSRGLVEAGWVTRHHFGRPHWRWAAKWAAHRFALRPGPARAAAAPFAAAAYRRRFDAATPPTPLGRRLLDSLARHDPAGAR